MTLIFEIAIGVALAPLIPIALGVVLGILLAVRHRVRRMRRIN